MKENGFVLSSNRFPSDIFVYFSGDFLGHVFISYYNDSAPSNMGENCFGYAKWAALSLQARQSLVGLSTIIIDLHNYFLENNWFPENYWISPRHTLT